MVIVITCNVNVQCSYRYHCMYSENEPDNDKSIEEEKQLEKTAIELQNQMRGILNKYQWLLMKDAFVSSTDLYFMAR